MSFESTKQSIENLTGSNITAEAMLDMLIRTTKDVYKNNGIKGANELRVSDGRQLVMKMNNLMNLLNRLYVNHSEALSQVTAETREDLKTAAEKLQQGEQVISGLDGEITAAEAQKTKLTEQNREVNEKRGHLKNVKAECDNLQKEIDTLNDPYLDELAEKKTALEADYNSRKSKADTLNDDITKLNGDIEQLTTLSQNRTKKLDELTKEKNRLDGALKTIEESIENTKKDIASHGEQEAALLASLDDEKARLEECRARFSVIQSAWNSAAQDAFLQARMFTGSSELVQVECTELHMGAETVTGFAQLEDWFDRTGKRIEALLQVYNTMLCSAVNRAKQLTAEQEGENT